MTYEAVEIGSPDGSGKIAWNGDPFVQIGAACALLAAGEIDEASAALAVIGHSRRIAQKWEAMRLGSQPDDAEGQTSAKTAERIQYPEIRLQEPGGGRVIVIDGDPFEAIADVSALHQAGHLDDQTALVYFVAHTKRIGEYFHPEYAEERPLGSGHGQ